MPQIESCLFLCSANGIHVAVVIEFMHPKHMCSPRPLPSQMGNQFVNLFRVQIGLDFAGSCRISNAAALRNGYKNLNKGKHFRPQIETHFQFQNLRKTAHTAPGSTCRYPPPLVPAYRCDGEQLWSSKWNVIYFFGNSQSIEEKQQQRAQPNT